MNIKTHIFSSPCNIPAVYVYFCNIFSEEEPLKTVDRKIDPLLVNCDRAGNHGQMTTHGLLLNYDNSFSSTMTPTATAVFAEEKSR